MIRIALRLSLTAALLAATFAHAVLRYDWSGSLLPQDTPPLAPSVQAEQRSFDQMFRAQGIEPDSNKAQIVRAWVNKIEQDPLITSAAPGGAPGIARMFLDPQAREVVMSNGLARLPAADRLSYVQLMTKFLDELVPADCFGFADMNDVMSEVSLREMSDAEVAQYFELLSKVLTSDALGSPIALPTRQQYDSALRQLAQALFVQLGGNAPDIARFESYSSNPSQATAGEACWATRVTLHAILSMSDPARDVILLLTILQASPQGETPAHDESPSAVPSPASVQPGRAPAR
jgi:hypothetical protein